LEVTFLSYALISMKTSWLNNAFIQFFNIIHNGVQSVFSSPNVSYGISIILVTIIIRGILFPLNYKQIRSSVVMNELQPEIKKLQTKYKSDPQKLQQETMKLYKEKGVNPLGGCLPLIIQWPILIALYYVFNNLSTIDPNINSATFLGLKLMGIPVLSPDKWYTWILPLLSGALTYYSTTMVAPKNQDNAQSKQMNTMSISMSILITFMSFKFTTALVIYWVTNSVVQIVQTIIIKRMEDNKLVKQKI